MSLAYQATVDLPPARRDALEALIRSELPHLLLEGVLGEGATAYVFAAKHLLLDLELALKVLRDPSTRDPAGAARLRREARFLASVGGEFAPRALDAGELSDGTPYVVMTRCRGQALAIHADRADLSVAEVVEVGQGLLEALHTMHCHGILHRDVKPDNAVLDGRRNGRTRVRLIDLGLAKHWNELDDDPSDDDAATLAQLTQPGTFVGTPSYIAPEQLMARAIDERADVYSAGASIYHLLTGVPPFHHADVHMTLAACLRDPFTPIAELRRGVPPAVAQVVERALARDPDDRFPDALAMLRALRAAAGACDPLMWGKSASIPSGTVPTFVLSGGAQL
jgi:eukaryotic-like serine/threonine-protein kinase